MRGTLNDVLQKLFYLISDVLIQVADGGILSLKQNHLDSVNFKCTKM